MSWRYLVWDMGGTMIDTYPSVDSTFVQVCVERGHPIDPQEVSLLTRRSIAEAGEELAERFGIPHQRFTAAHAALKESWRITPPPVMGGARELLARATELGGLNLVVTHRDRASASSLLQVHDLVVDELVCAPDGYPRKPDPTMHRVVVRRHSLKVADCLSVGDRAIDAEAAAAVGMHWAMLETPGIPVPVSGGLHVHSLAELLPRLG